MSSLPELSKMVSALSAKHEDLALTVSSNQDHNSAGLQSITESLLDEDRQDVQGWAFLDFLDILNL